MDAPLFHRAVSQGDQIIAAARPVNVADRLRRRVLCADLQGRRRGVLRRGAAWRSRSTEARQPLPSQVANLSGPDGAWANLPPASDHDLVVVDPELGRIALPPAAPVGGAAADRLVLLRLQRRHGRRRVSARGNVRRRTRHVPFPTPTPRYATTCSSDQLRDRAQLVEADTVAVELAGSAAIAARRRARRGPARPERRSRSARPTARTPTLLLGGEIAVTGDASSTFVLNGPASPPAPA